MEKLDMRTTDMVDRNIAKLGELFPNCLTERMGSNGKPQVAIDFDQLRQELSKDIIEGIEERYLFTWPDKRNASRLANTPTNNTLRPCRSESVDFDTTENLYIEGDNLEVLKILRENYLGKVKMIYIDPPYNTGNDFVYHDNFKQNSKEYIANSGQLDEDGNRLVQNPESNGRFHTDWLNMIYPRLKVAKDLLTDDGVIFISIDDNEVENLRKICSSNELFGEQNFIAQIIIDGTPKNDPYVVSTAHEYCLVYCRNSVKIKEANYGVTNPRFKDLIAIYNEGKGDYAKIERSLRQYYQDNGLGGDNISNYKFADKDGVYRIGPIDDPQNSGPKDDRINPKTGRKCATPSRGWSCTLATWQKWVRQNLIEFPESDDNLPSKKTYASIDRLDVMRAYFKMQTRKDTSNLKKLFGTPYTPFSNPKPVELIRQFIENCNDKEMIVLDFFSGSGTTLQATILQNLKDSGRRKCIMVQYPEIIKVTNRQSNKEKKVSQAALDFLSSRNLKPNICEIAKERIRRVGCSLKVVNKGKKGIEQLDTGFRVLKLDSTNMAEVYYTPADTPLDRELGFGAYIDNIKPDRTPEDLLFQILPECNLPLSSKIVEREINGKKIFIVNDGSLIACFDKEVDEATITAIAEMKPRYFIMRDASVSSDNVMDNFDQIFNTYSKDTIRRIL